MKIDHSIKRRLINAVKRLIPHLNAARRYRRSYGRWPDLRNPKEFNERIMAEIMTDKPIYARLADKLAVRDYVADRGYGDTLIPMIASVRHIRDIDIEALPSSFVIQPNNSSGAAFVVADKESCDLTQIMAEVQENVEYPFWCEAGEIHYRRIPPRVTVTQMLENDSALSDTLIDYKWYCFHGRPAFCMVCLDRDIESHRRVNAFYDSNWRRCDSEWAADDAVLLDGEVPRPHTLQRMLQACRDLVGDFAFARLDLYESRGQMYFGEITFTPNAFQRGIIARDRYDYMGALMEKK